MRGKWDSERKHPAASVRPRLPNSPAAEYFCPSIKQVGIEMVSDEPDFVPVCDESSSSAELFANIPSPHIDIAHNGSAVVDCGFSISLAPGYKCVVESLIPSVFVSVVRSPKFKLNVFNAGDNVRLIHKQKIARLWIEPVYLFEWIVKEKDE